MKKQPGQKPINPRVEAVDDLLKMASLMRRRTSNVELGDEAMRWEKQLTKRKESLVGA